VSRERQNALPSGTVLRNCYRIESVLGSGGFAITYLGRHTGLDQKVAIKEYMPDQFGVREPDGNTVRPREGSRDDYEHGLMRFSDEARTLAKFKHPGIVPVTDIFEANATAYMVMEYVEGESLFQCLQRKGSLSEPNFRSIFDPILAALEEIHAADILHRDIKPANIYVRADDTPVLLDFGNSREALGSKAMSLTVALTPGYAPNEQYSSRGKQGPWTDIYSLGATMYRAVAGMDPPEAPDRALDDDYVPLAMVKKGPARNYSPEVLSAIDMALAVRPDDRPQDIASFRAALRTAFDGAPAGTQVPHTILPEPRPSIRPASSGITVPGLPRLPGNLNWRPVAIAASVLVLLGVGGGIGWMKYEEAETRRLAEEATQRRIAAELQRAETERRKEGIRWERAALDAQLRAEEQARMRAAWERRVRFQRVQRQRAEEARREEVRRQIKAERNSGLVGGVRNFFERILPGAGKK